MEVNFKNKVIVITGSTSGIGKKIAELFSKEGGDVAINSRTEKEVFSVTDSFARQGYSVMGVPGDVGNEDDVSRITERIVSRFGRIDVLINNAAIREMKPESFIESISRAEWEKTMRTNLTGAFEMSKAVISIMKQQKEGVVINILSQAIAFVPGLHGSAYIASKGGLAALTKALSAEVGLFGIRVNGIMPGFIETDVKRFNRKNSSAWFIKTMEFIPLRKWGLPDDIANACFFLASDMARYITGEVLAVNGGMPSSILT